MAVQLVHSPPVQRLRPLDPSYLKEFERLVRAAENEKQDDW
jgi:hypothetical protein